MKSGVFNLGVGLIAVALGASGHAVLPGTENPNWLVLAGAAVTAFGVFQLWRNRGK
jgi:hypothetical protein